MKFAQSIPEYFRSWRYESLLVTGETEVDEHEARGHQQSEKWSNNNLRKPFARTKTSSVWAVIISILLAANLVAIISFTMRIANSSAFKVPIVQPLSDTIFGHIPVRQTMWHPDESFTLVDPWDGAYWNNNTDKKATTAWDSLFRSAWISVDNPRAHGLSGGVPLRHFAPLNFKDTWSESAEGYVPTVIHQLHCVGILKHLVEVQKSPAKASEDKDYGSLDALIKHGEHCTEYFRHSFMCAADLTLEPPETVDLDKLKVHGTEGWGAPHSCRDWNVVHDRLWERLIKFVNFGEHGMRILPDDA